MHFLIGKIKILKFKFGGDFFANLHGDRMNKIRSPLLKEVFMPKGYDCFC